MLTRVTLSCAVAGVLGLIGGCGPEQACSGIAVGTQMKITLLGPAATEPGSRTAICDFGVGQGIVIDAKVVDAVDSRGVCKEAIPQYGPVGGWAWTLDDAKSVTAVGGGPGVVAG
ncbi:MAG TPA: hypothetical protein VGI39_16830, partial [Polyangiaceae bacterium]